MLALTLSFNPAHSSYLKQYYLLFLYKNDFEETLKTNFFYWILICQFHFFFLLQMTYTLQPLRTV